MRNREDITRTRPVITLRVGVTGHRFNKIKSEQKTSIQYSADAVLEGLRSAVRDVREQDQWAFAQDEGPSFHFTSSLAAGADCLLAQRALRANYDLRAILPLPREEYRKDFTDSEAATFEDLLAKSESVMEMISTGDPSAPDARNQAYLASGRAVLDHCDVLLAVWDGAPPAGVGGTAEIVEEANSRALIVVWVPVDGSKPKLRIPHEHGESGEWLTVDPDADKVRQAIRSRIIATLAPPKNHDAKAALRTFLSEKPKSRSFAIGYEALRMIFAKRPWQVPVRYSTAGEKRAEWQETFATAEAVGTSRFRERLEQVLFWRWHVADAVALHYSHIYRTTFIANFLLAALAVLAGLTAVVNWDSIQLKAAMVAVEIVIIFAIIIITTLGRRRRWQERWLEARTVAEALRPARLLALIGATPSTAPVDIGLTAGDSWTSWYIRATWREIGPPSGVLDSDALTRVLRVAMEEEIGDSEQAQISYHIMNAKNLHMIDHKLHRMDLWFFGLTIASCLTFLALFVTDLAMNSNYAKYFKPFATILGAALPAFGASILGIRATGDFKTAANNSRHMAIALTRHRNALEAMIAQDGASLSRCRSEIALARVTETLSADLRVWRLVYAQREISLPG